MSNHALSQEFPVDGPIGADIRLGSGTVRVIAEDRAVVAVDIDASDHRGESRQAAEHAEVDFDGNELSIRVPQGGRAFWRGGGVQITVRLPSHSRLTTHAGSADLQTEGHLTEVQVKTGSGDVQIDQAAVVRGESGSGDVSVGEVGELRFTTGSGDVSARRITTAAGIRTASGDVNIADGHGDLRINTASGDVNLRSISGQQADIQTASGDVHIGVPAGTGVWLDLRTSSGSTTSDLAMTDAPGQTSDQQPVLRLEVRTASGDIALRRVATTRA